MSDDMLDPKVPEQPGEPTPEAGLSRSQPAPDTEPAGAGQGEESSQREQPRKSTTGGLLRRLTGTLRRVTGPLGKTGSLGETGVLSEPQPAASEPVEPEVYQPQAVQPPLEPRESTLRRDTGMLGGTGPLADTGMLPALDPDEPEVFQPPTPEPPLTPPREDLLRRDTGLLGGTGSLVDTGMLPPLEQNEPEVYQPPEPEQPLTPPRGDTLRRDTGQLGGTGPLGDTGALHPRDLSEPEVYQPPEPEPPVRESPLRRDADLLSDAVPSGDTAPLPELFAEDEPSQEAEALSPIEELAAKIFGPPDKEAQPPAFDWMAGIREEARQADGDETLYQEIWDTPQPAEEETYPLEEIERRATGALRESAELPGSDAPLTPDLFEQPAPPDWMAEIRGEAEEPLELPPQPEIQDALLAPEPSSADLEEQPPAETPETQSRMKRVTGSLRRIITGALRRQPSEPEMPDDMLSGRLERSMRASPKPAEKEKTGRTTGSLLGRVTGSLRRVTGSLRDSGELPGSGSLERPAQPPSAPDWAEQIRQDLPPSDDVQRRMTGPLRESSELPDSDILYMPESFEQPAQPDWMAEIRDEAEEPLELPPQLDRPVTPPEPEPPFEQPPGPQSPLKRMTGSLRRIITGALHRQQPDEPGISDDVLSGRLERSLTSGPKPAEKEKRGRTTGSLIRRVTGSLRRVTGSLRDTGGLPGSGGLERPEPAQPSPVEPGRMPRPTQGAEDEDFMASVREVQPGLQDEDAITLLESGAIAALDRAEQQKAEPDWMRTIREETTREGGAEPPEEGASGLGRMTGSLRKFVSDTMKPEEKRRQEAQFEPQPEQAPEIEDDFFAGRFGQAADDTAQGAAEAGISSETQPAWRYDDTSTGAEPDEDVAFLDSLEARFGQFDDMEAGEDLIGEFTAQAEEENPFDFLSGAASNIWGETEPAAFEDQLPGFTPQAAWDDAPEAAFGPDDLAQQLWGEAAETEATQPAAPFRQEAETLTGQGFEVPLDEYGAEELAAQPPVDRLDRSTPFVDIRSIALEDYEDDQEWMEASRRAREEAARAAAENELADEEILAEDVAEAAAVIPAAAAEVAVVQEESYLSQPAWNLKAWLALHNRFEKVILYEAALVVLAVLVAVPFFLFMIARGPVIPESQRFTPRSLPSDMPTPTGLILPGGWSFPLQKSSVADGQWKPVTSEWLEGTELRRIIALPWNEQTEAVVQTFNTGDPMALNLSNGSTLNYKIESVERLSVTDTTIYNDLSPSLVIILYDEQAAERWVVVGKP